MLADFIRQEFTRGPCTASWRRWSRCRCCKHFKAPRRPARYNGAALLGLRGLVFKSHGSADAFAFEQALARAYDAARNRLLDRVHDRIAQTLQAVPDAVGSAGRLPSRMNPIARLAIRASPAPAATCRRGASATTTWSSMLAARGIETSDDWIVERTGIRARHFADDGVSMQRPGAARPRARRWRRPAAAPTTST